MKKIFSKVRDWFNSLSEKPFTVLFLFIGAFALTGLIVFLCTPGVHLNIDWHALDFE